MPDEVEDRLLLLEASSQVQEEVITALQAEQIDAGRLSESVERLGLNAADLGVALLTVDRTQRTLAKLSEDITRVETGAATVEDVDTKVLLARSEVENQAAAIRKKTAVRLYAAGVLILALIFAVGLGAVNAVNASDREIEAQCRNNLQTSIAVADYLRAVGQESINPELRMKAQSLIDLLPPADDPEACTP